MPAKRCSGRSGNFSIRKRSRRQPVVFAQEKGGGILFLPTRNERGSRRSVRSPRSGRTKIAQRFIAGYERLIRSLVREAGDRAGFGIEPRAVASGCWRSTNELSGSTRSLPLTIPYLPP